VDNRKALRGVEISLRRGNVIGKKKKEGEGETRKKEVQWLRE